jgi:hypothetical protein
MGEPLGPSPGVTTTAGEAQAISETYVPINLPHRPRPPIPGPQILRCSQDGRFVQAVEAEFARLDQEIADHRPTCWNRGECCQFGKYGHRLFVTSAELAYFLARSEGPIQPVIDPGACPYQIGGLCTTRPGRPIGCRVFFCDPQAAHWQPQASEAALARFRTLHGAFDLPYVYIEWLEGLRQLARV